MSDETEIMARAFNRGCDARIAGMSLSANPYNLVERPECWLQWRLGYKDVDRYWGRNALWHVRPLPRLREVA